MQHRHVVWSISMPQFNLSLGFKHMNGNFDVSANEKKNYQWKFDLQYRVCVNVFFMPLHIKSFCVIYSMAFSFETENWKNSTMMFWKVKTMQIARLFYWDLFIRLAFNCYWIEKFTHTHTDVQNHFSWKKYLSYMYSVYPQIQVSWERISNIFLNFFNFSSKYFASVKIKANSTISFLMHNISIIFALEFYNCSQWVVQQMWTEQNQLTGKDNYLNL